jgi:hypothetical protein
MDYNRRQGNNGGEYNRRKGSTSVEDEYDGGYIDLDELRLNNTGGDIYQELHKIRRNNQGSVETRHKI